MIRIIVLLFVFFASTPSLIAQSGWTRGAKTYFLKLGYNTFSSDNYFNIDGEELNTSKFHQKEINFYGEYGITDRFTVIVSMPLVRWNRFETTETVAGIGDLRTEIKYALFRNKIPVSISVAPEFPTGPKNLYAQNTTNTFEEINLPTGDGEFNIWTTLAGSVSFSNLPAYASFSTAYNFRTKFEDINFQDQVKFNLELGYEVINDLWVNGILSTMTSLGEKNPVTDFVRGDGTSYTAWGVGAAYEIIPHYSLNVTYWNYAGFLFPLENIYSAPTYSIGIFYELK